MIRHLQKQFKVSTQQEYPFEPEKEIPKTAKIYLNSQDRMFGTNNEATFKVNMPCNFTSSNVAITLTNFIPTYPSGAEAGIVNVNMVGVENPNSYSSRNNSTHRTIGTFALMGETVPREYPPSALTGSPTNLTGQTYGNGTYTLSASTSAQAPWLAFNRNSNGNNNWGSRFVQSNGLWEYNFSNGIYAGATSFFTTNVDGSNVSGEWLNIQLPTPIVLQEYRIQGNPVIGQGDLRSPNTFTLAGSMDGTNFNRIDTKSNIDWWGSNNTYWNTFATPLNTASYSNYRLIVHRVGNSNTTSFRNGVQVNEMILVGLSNPQTGTSMTPPLRIGQCNMNAEVISTDRNMFDRPITLQLTSPTGLNLSSFSNWSCELNVKEIPY